MHPDNRQAFADLLAEVMAYYRKPCSAFLVGIFWDSLTAHSFEDVSRAFTLHAKDPDQGKFEPKVADITRMLEGSAQTQGMRAWAKVERAIRCVGGNRSVTFDDPLIHVVIVEMGGWTQLCRSSEADLPFKAREFEKRYAPYRMRREVPPFPSRLIGGHEADNRLNGYVDHEAHPVLIGNQTKALRVLERGHDSTELCITDAKTVTGSVFALLAEQHTGQSA